MRTVLLRGMKKSNNPRKSHKRKHMQKRGKCTTCAQPTNNTTARTCVPNEAQLLADCSPDLLRLIHTYLENPLPADRAFLDAWERLGRNDATREPQALISRQAKNTVSALGLACLVRYARGYEDESLARAIAKSTKVA